MTNQHEPHATDDPQDQPRRDASESDFARVERAGFEAMQQRDPLTEDGRLVTDPGQDMRAPEERPTIHQAFPEIPADESAQREYQMHEDAR